VKKKYHPPCCNFFRNKDILLRFCLKRDRVLYIVQLKKIKAMKKRGLYCLLLFCNLISAQNLLDTSTWTVGTGSVTGFSSNGSSVENNRILGTNHLGENVVLWEAIPNAPGGADGGWNSTYHSVNYTKAYRYSVWIKKTNTTSGTTYFGCDEPSDKIKELSGVTNSNPYFWAGDLPRLERWYLLVGFVHESTYSSTTNVGAIYDGITGKKVQSIDDFKMSTGAISLRHRAYLYYDANASNRQYFYAPRMELVNGSEPTLEELLGVNPDSKVTFTYDTAGNQTNIVYCTDQSCTSSSKSGSKKGTASEENSIKTLGDVEVYPNPTKGEVVLRWENEAEDFVKTVTLIHLSNGANTRLPFKANLKSIEIDMTQFKEGVYVVSMKLKDGTAITKKIIKI